MAKNKENRSLTVDKELLKDVDEEVIRLKNELEGFNGTFSGFTSITYDFYFKYHGKVDNLSEQKENGRGFTLVSPDKRVGDFAQLPKRGSDNSAGYDFYLPKNVMIRPGESSELIFTNVKAYMNKGEVLELYIRSSIGIKKGIVLKNGTGVIDKDYHNNPNNEGNIGISLINLSNETVLLEEGERIMQGIFKPFLASDNCNTDSKREGGFGSTNK